MGNTAGGVILLVAGVAILCVLPFLPLIQELGDAVVTYMGTIPALAGTPILPIVGLMPVFVIGIIFIAIGWAVVKGG